MSDLEESFRENTFDQEAVIASMQQGMVANQSLPTSGIDSSEPMAAAFGSVNGFEETGNQIAVNPDQMIAEVKERLRQFDHSGDRSQSNPYRETVVISLDDGRQVAVPSQLQLEAVREWESEKEILYRGRSTPVTTSSPTEEAPSAGGSKMLWVVIAVALAWFFFRSRQ